MKKLIAIHLLLMVLTSCYNIESYYDDFDRGLLPEIVIEANDPTANGSDEVKIKVLFPLESDRNLINVNFKTDLGTFKENKGTTFSSSEAVRNGSKVAISATLKASTQATAHNVEIEVPNVYKASRPIVFAKSYPLSIAISTNKFSTQASYQDEIQLIATLKSAPGKPSNGTNVEFIVADSLSSSTSSRFRALTTSNAEGMASVFFTAGSFQSYRGPVTIKAITQTELGAEIMASTTMQIVNPE